MNWKTIGVGECRVCGRSQSLLKSHICPDCRRYGEPATEIPLPALLLYEPPSP